MQASVKTHAATEDLCAAGELCKGSRAMRLDSKHLVLGAGGQHEEEGGKAEHKQWIVGAQGSAKIREVTSMRPIHGNL